MTDKELRKLSRRELLEMLIEQSEKNEQLQQQLDDAERQLKNKRLMVQRSGSIAEASLKLNEVFEAAQKAAEQYLENIRAMQREQEAKTARFENAAQTFILQLNKRLQAIGKNVPEVNQILYEMKGGSAAGRRS